MRLRRDDGSLNGKVLREVVGRLKERMEFRGGWRVTLVDENKGGFAVVEGLSTAAIGF